MRFTAAAILCLLAVPAFAAEDADYGGGSFVVTPVEDCFAKIAPADAVTIRRDYASPYSECLKRLQEQREKEAAAKAEAKPVKKKKKKKTEDGEDLAE
jgi:hypothetical protein